MNAIGSTDQCRLFLTTALATRGQQLLALVIAAAALAAFAATVPFVRVPLAKMPAFIPRELLAGGHLDDTQLRSIERLLVEEETKLFRREP
jgi:hypothetical protein